MRRLADQQFAVGEGLAHHQTAFDQCDGELRQPGRGDGKARRAGRDERGELLLVELLPEQKALA